MFNFRIAVFAVGSMLAFACLSLNQTVYAAGPKAARAMERLEGLREGTKRANRLMGVNTRRVPWCGYAVKYAVKAAGKKPVAHFASARSWERWGRNVRLNAIRRGDVAIFRTNRSRSGRHVAIVTAVKGNKIKVCGGNTKNRVFCNWRSKKRISKVRR